jgi:radical SAM protein with 4Fe4S-binding SPASM domain
MTIANTHGEIEPAPTTLTNVTAVLSMLHEPADRNSATRTFRRDPVLSWTLDRLTRSKRLGTIAILCWDDQIGAVHPLAEEHHAHVLMKSPRMATPALESVAAAQRWADGWRGGLLGTCEFDAGFYGPWVLEVARHLSSDAVIVLDPASGLVDPELIDRMIDHADEHADVEMLFTQAAPGLSGALLRPALLERLASMKTHPGRVLHYLPDQPMRDPISTEACVPVPTPVARSTRRFKLDSDRQIRHITAAAVSLNGQLIASSAEELLYRLGAHDALDPMPRDVTVEINTRRGTSPIYWCGRHAPIDRGDLAPDAAATVFAELSGVDDIRLTLGGVGDPLLHPRLAEIIDAAKDAGIRAIHVETDLLAPATVLDELVDSAVDVISVYMPAITSATYRAVMGIDGIEASIDNVKRMLVRRQELGRGVPLVVPTFVKCAANLGEMEVWYDQWLKVLGAATIVGPTDYAGLIADAGVADMSPPKRRPCARLNARLTILSDGRIVACEQDVTGRNVIGHIERDSIADVWRQKMQPLRADHAAGCWAKHATCAACKEWHRP